MKKARKKVLRPSHFLCSLKALERENDKVRWNFDKSDYQNCFKMTILGRMAGQPIQP